MNTNMFTKYYEYKIKTVFEYSILLSKIIGIDKNKLWHRKKNLEDSLKWIIKEFFNNDISYDKNLIRCFITDKEIFKYRIDKELYCAISYFIENNRALEIKAYEKEIILSAVILNIANNLDICTSPYKINANNYKTILINYLEKYNKISYFNLIDEKKKNTTILLELIKTNVRKERKIFELLNSNISFNRYIDISKSDIYYLAQYNYSVPGFSKIDKSAIKDVYEKEKVDLEFALISKDLIIATIMKLFSIRKLRKVFFLPVKKELLKTNVKELGLIYKDKVLSKYFKVLINYDDFNKNTKSVLKKNMIDYFIYISKSVKIDIKKVAGERCLLSNDFAKSNAGIIEELKKNNCDIIVEEYEKIQIDKELLKESEK